MHALLGIAIAALALRIAYVLTLSQLDNAPVNGDFLFFHRAANLLADGTGYIRNFTLLESGGVVPTAEHPPLWPFLLSLVSRLGGTSEVAHRLVGVPLGTGTVVAIGLLGRRIHSERSGLLSASMAATYPIMIGADGSLMSESLYGLLIASVLLSAISFADRPTLPRVLLLGVLVGTAALTRAEALALVPLLVLPLALRAKHVRWKTLAVSLVATAVVVAPWTARNWVRFDRLVVISTNDGSVLRGANCGPAYYGEDTGFWRLDCLTPPFDPDEAAVFARWRREGLTYAGQHLDRLPVVLAARELRTWSLWDPSHGLRFAEGRNMGVEKAGLVMYYLLSVLAAVGLVLLHRQRRPLYVIVVPIVLVVAMTAAAYGYAKFRFPAEVSLVVLAGAGLVELLPTGRKAGDAIRTRHRLGTGA